RSKIAIANRLAVQIRRPLNSIGEVQQLTDADLRFARIVLPLRDGVTDAGVQFEEAVADRAERRDSPKTFGAAKNRPSAVDRATIGVTFKHDAAILHHQGG